MIRILLLLGLEIGYGSKVRVSTLPLVAEAASLIEHQSYPETKK